MNRLAATIIATASLIGTGILTEPVSASDKQQYGKPGPMHVPGGVPPGVVFLPREVSESLEITRVPTSRPVPLIVGTYWSCHVNAHDFEICRIKLVVCTDDQSFCTEVP